MSAQGALVVLLLLALPVAPPPAAATTAAEYGGCSGTVPSQVLDTDPSQDYRAVVAGLGPGDLLRLAAGTYTLGLPLENLHGEPDNCILIEGPASGPPAVFTGSSSRNTVSLTTSSYLVVRNLELDGLGLAGNGVKLEGSSGNWAHHITLENLHIRRHDSSQQNVGINTKGKAWSWVIRSNVIETTGTGIYLGDSDGEQEFVHGLIEHNLIVDTIGYNMQIKHQNGRDTGLGMPADGRTIVRHNVFAKASGGATGGSARPNLLLGQLPESGAGAADDYLVYGNLFYQNPTESLFQATGNVSFYGNLMVNDGGPAVRIQTHEGGVPRRIRILHNTVVASTTGIAVSSRDPDFEQRVAGNAVFATTPLSLVAGVLEHENTTEGYLAAGDSLGNPGGAISGAGDRLSLFPLAGALQGPVDLSAVEALPDLGIDFDYRPRTVSFRGAYAGEGKHDGWLLALERKPEPPPALFADAFESGDTTGWAVAAGSALRVCASGSFDGGCSGGASRSGTYHGELTVARSCTQDDLTVPDGELADAVVEACRELSADGVTVTGGTVRFRAGAAIRLGDGFSVAAGASFVAEVSPAVTGNAYLRDESPDAEPAYHVRFYLDPDGLTLAAGSDGFEHLLAYDAQGSPQLVVGLTYNEALAELRLYLTAFDDDGTAHSTRGLCELPLGAGWQSVEATWEASTGTGGDATLSLDGVIATSLSDCLGLGDGLANPDGRIDAVEWGAPGEISPGNLGVLRLDAFDSRRAGPIGGL